MKKAILYLNQFFGQIGGEEKANFPPEIREGLVGPAMELQKRLGDSIEVTHTIICGDNYMGSNTEEAIETILGFLEAKEFDIFFAGPAFRAGRYGSACGHIGKAVKEKFNVPIISSMNEENPGVEMFREHIYIFKGGASAAAMRKDIKKMAAFGKRILNGEELLSADEEGYYGRGIRRQVWLKTPITAADRVVDMLLKKVHGEPFQTELPIPEQDMVPIAEPIKDLSKAKIAMVTSGGIVPADNPDRIQSASATRWGKYSVANMDRLEPGVFKTIHAGFDPAAANADPNVIVPLDVMKTYEKEGKIGKVNDYFYSTVGTGTTQGEAARMGKEIVADLKESNVDGVILVST
ncbi:Selenoprotein B,glycine/betaine/sarcosine/D-proline reductase family protein [[Clostridium] ultunense Esp]|uniref:Selenoprotein B,glycine/betaine/sarcosine/D-proline reductase family protein n=3 Tax=Schnuerera ultunensis TaxID=45497 RepID=A0A1M4PKM8_9FIRM|nr:Selenoprotein B,glycine/betaine/sarcosine/D-proline reductase family protein [[Clostridium] ultunense Esp]